MTEQNKKLLLKDLCARLPYGVKVHLVYDEDTEDIREMGLGSLHDIIFDNAEGKPYLRPMSSMTEDEQKTLDSMCNGVEMVSRLSGLKMFDKAFDWLNANHFNYRLPPHLFIEAPEGMYKTIIG